jgi:protein XRP2
MSTSDSAETERVIRQKLEASGQYGKMRAMIMEAALQTVQATSAFESSSANNNSGAKAIFAPSAALIEAKKSGVTELSILVEYLRSLGLQYTESVLKMEAGLAAVPLQSSEELRQRFSVSVPGTCLAALVQGVAAPAAQSGVDGVTSPTQQQPVAVVEEPADESDAASDHDQPGGEDTTYFISNWRKRHFVRHQQVSGQQVQLDRLTDCQTVVLDELDSMTVDDCEGGELVIAACEGSVFLRNCKNMTVHVACKQLRTRDCEDIDLHIFTTTDPVVEMSHNVHFYPFHLRLPQLCKLFAEARLDPKTNRFVHVYDFTPSVPDLLQPHFQVHFPEHGQVMEDRCASYGTPECPPEVEQLLALQLMPAASSESGKNKSYDIKTGAQIWAATGVAAAAAAAVGEKAAAPATTATKKDDFDESESEAHSSVHSSSVSDVENDSGSSSGSDGSVDSKELATATANKKKAAVDPVAETAGHAATPGGLENEEYSSFDDESDAHDADDKYDVDEDEDDF